MQHSRKPAKTIRKQHKNLSLNNECKLKIRRIQLYHPKSEGFDFGFFEKVEKQCWSRIRIGLVHYITNKN